MLPHGKCSRSPFGFKPSPRTGELIEADSRIFAECDKLSSFVIYRDVQCSEGVGSAGSKSPAVVCRRAANIFRSLSERSLTEVQSVRHSESDWRATYPKSRYHEVTAFTSQMCYFIRI